MTEPRRVRPEDIVPLVDVPFGFFTGHVQGITVRGESLFFSSVDTEDRSGLIFRISRKTFELEQMRRIRIPPDHYHPGGIACAGDTILVPLAEYRPHSRAVVLAFDPDSLEYTEEFRADDHLGAVARDARGTTICANWDAESFLFFDPDGNLLQKTPNSSGIAYQDMEFRGDSLFCSGLVKSNRSLGRVDEYGLGVSSSGAMSVELLGSFEVPAAPTGKNGAHEGMTFLDEKLLLLPDDYPDTCPYSAQIPPANVLH